MRTNTLFKILSVFAAVSLAGCDVKDPIYNTAHPGGVVVTASNTAWDAGDCIGISASSEKGKTNYVNIRYKTDGTVFHPVPGAAGEDNTIYFQDASPTEFTAYHPCEGVNGTRPGSEGILTKEITAADQSTANLPAIDYLWAQQTAQSSSPKVDFLFSHRMSRVILKFKAGDGVVFPAEGLTYTLTGVATAGTFDTATGEAKAMGTASTLENLPSTITTGGQPTGTVILWPQAVNAVRLQLTLNGTTFGAALTFPAGTAGEALAPATSYTFNVNVERAGIKIEKADIEDWTDGGSKDVTLQQQKTRTLTYSSGLTGGISTHEVLEGATVVILNEAPGSSPSGKTFVGWNTKSEGGGEFYAPGSTLTMPAKDLFLYALWSGDGSAEDNPVLITDVQGMKNIGAGSGENIRKHYRLCNDLVLDDWEAIHWEKSLFFSGTFDGGGHTVTLNGVKPMVYISPDPSDRNVYYFGLFAKIGSGKVRRLRVDGQITVNATDGEAAYYAGGICGHSDNGSVTDCISDVTITVTGKFYELYAGGITGYNEGNIFNCYATGKIESTATVQFVSLGGIAGINAGRVANCAALNSDISGKNGEKNTYIWRITGGGSGYFVNNYASSTLTVSGTKEPDKPNGADCDPRPAASWWKDSGTWAASSPYTPWDFSTIWEVTNGNLPQFRPR